MTRWVWVLLAVLGIAASVGLGWQQIELSTQRNWIDTNDVVVLAQGRETYGQYCASCHGANLEGQRDWMKRLPSGRMPAPPHDETGHTWHHPPAVLFGIVKDGVEKYAPAGYGERHASVWRHAYRRCDSRGSCLHLVNLARRGERRYAELQARNR